MEGESMAPSSDMGGMGSNPDAYPVKSMGDYSDAGPDGHHQDQGGMDQGHYNGNGNGANDEEPKQEEAPKTDSFDLFGSMLSKMPAKEEEEKKEEEEVKKEENNDKKDAFDSMFDSATKEEKDEDEEEKKDNTEDGDEETKPDGEEGSTKEEPADNSENEDNENKDNENENQDNNEDQDDANKDYTINSEGNREYTLPHGWKKIGSQRKQGESAGSWDIYVISPDGTRLRSNPEIQRYLDKNPDVECDQEVTNTTKPDDLQTAPSRSTRGATSAAKEAVSKKEKDALVKSPKNFLEENISEAFKTLEVYQKALETERTRCIKGVKEGMTVDTSTSITRKLRKLYAVTQKNMDLLDRAIVESFVENFPTESTRIHMGRVAPPPQPKYAAPAKRGAKGKKKPAPRGKVKIKPKKGKGPVKGKKKGVIELNGAPDYVEYDLPKKRKGVYRDDDVECIDVSEDDEYYNPKKRSRPGPASSKKGKPGPASKKRW